MKFIAIKRIFPDQPIWGARQGSFTFIITQDEDGYTASVKVVGATPYDGSRHDLGGCCAHRRFVDAEAACKKFLKEWH